MKRATQAMERALLGALVLAFIATVGWSQSLTWLGTLQGGSGSDALGVSADGSVVVGRAWISTGYWRAFRWESGVMTDLGTLGGYFSEAYGVSADGSVVVGVAAIAPSYYRAFRWSAATGMQDLGTLGGFNSIAYGVSADGSVVVGGAEIVPNAPHAFRWTQTGGMRDLGTLGGYFSEAYSVSADGSVVVGRSYNAAGDLRAFRWSAATGMVDLGTLPGGSWSEALGVSADGSVVVGKAVVSNYGRAFRWSAATGMVDLGMLPGGSGSEALGVSADGSVVVGGTFVGNYGRAFRWTPQRGMEDLNVLYASLISPGSVLRWASAISPNGRFIVGNGDNAQTRRTEAFLMDTWETFLPQSFTLLRGFVLAGGLSDLFYSDDQHLWLIPGFVLNQAEAPIQIVVRGTAPVTQPLQVTLVWEVSSDVSNIEERVELYNFSTRQWDLVNQQVITRRDTRHEVSRWHPGYVSSTGEVRARLSYRAIGLVPFFPWQVRLDETSFAIIR